MERDIFLEALPTHVVLDRGTGGNQNLTKHRQTTFTEIRVTEAQISDTLNMLMATLPVLLIAMVDRSTT